MLGQLSFPRTHFFLYMVSQKLLGNAAVFILVRIRALQHHLLMALCLMSLMHLNVFLAIWISAKPPPSRGHKPSRVSGSSSIPVFHFPPFISLILQWHYCFLSLKKICNKWQIAQTSTGNTRRGGYLSLRDYADRNFSRQNRNKNQL